MRKELNKLLYSLENLNRRHENLGEVLLEIENKFPDRVNLVEKYKNDQHKSLRTFIKEVRAADRIHVIKYIPREMERANAAIKLLRAKFNGISFKLSHGKYIVYSSDSEISTCRLEKMKELAKYLCVTLTDNPYKEESLSRIKKASPTKLDSVIENLLFKRMNMVQKISRLKKDIEELELYLADNGEKLTTLQKAHNIMNEME